MPQHVFMETQEKYLSGVMTSVQPKQGFGYMLTKLFDSIEFIDKQKKPCLNCIDTIFTLSIQTS